MGRRLEASLAGLRDQVLHIPAADGAVEAHRGEARPVGRDRHTDRHGPGVVEVGIDTCPPSCRARVRSNSRIRPSRQWATRMESLASSEPIPRRDRRLPRCAAQPPGVGPAAVRRASSRRVAVRRTSGRSKSTDETVPMSGRLHPASRTGRGTLLSAVKSQTSRLGTGCAPALPGKRGPGDGRPRLVLPGSRRRRAGERHGQLPFRLRVPEAVAPLVFGVVAGTHEDRRIRVNMR